MILVAWIFGIGGIVSNFAIYQQTSRKGLLTVKLVADCLWALHYGFLGAWSGTAVCAIGILREAIFLNEQKKWAQGKKWLVVFLLLSLICALLTWEHPFSILPTIASAISVFSFWKGNPKLTRVLSFPISACFMTYDISCLSYIGILNEVIVLISTVIGLVKMRKTE